MCPVCIATAATTAVWLVAGATSAGSLTALVVKGLRARADAETAEPEIQTEGDSHGSPQNRVPG